MSKPVEAIYLPPAAQAAFDTLERCGHEAWAVGGWVRDALRSNQPDDIDIACSCPPEETKQCFEASGFHTFDTGIKHGTITAIVRGVPIEVTTYRTDGTYSDARHPDSVTFVRTIEEDLARRDFTMNAIAYHPQRGLCDPYGGARDIEAHVIRCVGDANVRLQEDPLRTLRGLRFASETGFAIAEPTFAAMMDNRSLLTGIAAERISHELTKLLCGAHVHDAVMQGIDIITVVLPELAPCKGFDQHNRYHIYDVLEHIMHAVQAIPPTPLLRWTALLHDIGKPACYFEDESGRGHFYGHPAISARIAHEILRRLKMPNDISHDIELLVQYHDVNCPPTPKAVRRVLLKLDGEPRLLRSLLEMKRADALAQAPHCAQKLATLAQVEEVLDVLVAEQAAFKRTDLAINGRDIMALGVEAGPCVGALLDVAFEAYLDGRVQNDREQLLAVVTDALAKSQ